MSSGQIVHLSISESLGAITRIADKTEKKRKVEIDRLIEDFLKEKAKLIKSSTDNQYQVLIFPTNGKYKVGFVKKPIGAKNYFLFVAATADIKTRVVLKFLTKFSNQFSDQKPSTENMDGFLTNLLIESKDHSSFDVISKCQKLMESRVEEVHELLRT